MRGSVDELNLLESLRAGDEEHFRRFVTGLAPTLTRLARSYTATDAAAQDAVQDTWLVVIDRLDSFQGRSSLSTWVCGVLVHTARRRGVHEARVLPFSSAWQNDAAPLSAPRASTPGPSAARPAPGAILRCAGRRCQKSGWRPASCEK